MWPTGRPFSDSRMQWLSSINCSGQTSLLYQVQYAGDEIALDKADGGEVLSFGSGDQLIDLFAQRTDLLLPQFWQGVSQINPIVYMVNAFRYGFLGISDVDLTLSFAVLGVFIVALYTVAMTLISKGIGLRS